MRVLIVSFVLTNDFIVVNCGFEKLPKSFAKMKSHWFVEKSTKAESGFVETIDPNYDGVKFFSLFSLPILTLPGNYIYDLGCSRQSVYPTKPRAI